MRFLSTLLASTLGVLLAMGFIFFVGLLFFAALVASADRTPRVPAGSVLVVAFDGGVPEVAADDPFARIMGDAPGFDLRDLTASLEKAAADDRIEAVWLQMKGIDAQWATLQEIRESLLRFKQAGKPIIASADDYGMDEADYFVASVADSVFAAPQSMFEFNGFYLAVEFYKNLLDKLEIEPQIVRAGRFKSAVEPFIRDDLSPENEEQLTALLLDQNQTFLSAIAESRGRPADSIRAIIEREGLLSSQDARNAGLLDGLRYHDQVASILRGYLGQDEGEDLRSVALSDYARTSATDAGLEYAGDGDVAVVYAEGAIVSGKSEGGPFGGDAVIGAETFNKAMREARESDRVKAVVLRINSPGGSASASEAMWREIRLTAEQKPVVVSMGAVAASGGYWIATAADTIVADPLTITGSIGVFYTLFDVGDLFANKLGVTFDILRTSPYADLLSGLRPLSAPERRLLQRSADETYDAFLQKVSQSRGLALTSVDSLAQGRIWTGLQAREIGLVDVLGDLDTAVRIAGEMAGLGDGPYRTRVLPRPKTMIERLGASLNARTQSAWVQLRTTPTERALLDHARTLRRLLSDHGTVQARMPVTIRVE